MHLTIVPSATSVRLVICSKGCHRHQPNHSPLVSTWTTGTTHHAFRPLVHHLHQAKLEGPELLSRDLVSLLHAFDAFGDRDDRVAALGQFGRDDGLDLGLLLEDEARQEGGDLFWFVPCESVLEDELRQHELVGRVDLGR
jgi:hypothetical protein